MSEQTRSVMFGQPVQAGQAGHAGQMGQAGQAGHAGQPGQPGQAGQDGQAVSGRAPGGADRPRELAHPGPEETPRRPTLATPSAPSMEPPAQVSSPGAPLTGAPLIGSPLNGAPPVTGGGDVGRRVSARREELGLTRETVAVRAGITPGYLRYLETRPTATPGAGALIRIADALDTSVSALHGGEADPPPGAGRAAAHSELIELDPEECRARLSTHGVGRIVLQASDRLLVLPVNYSVVDGSVVFRTAPGSAPAAALGARVAFEVDHIDEALAQGWSVLVQGRARAETRPDATRRLDALAHTRPWAGGAERDLWVRVEEESISGRRIVVR